ncbi:hypothetical protein BS78_05G267600 [Paspalum vaginatum]|nr:hypothetical protein BS78_05G267600 [Paspalum vaginatum]
MPTYRPTPPLVVFVPGRLTLCSDGNRLALFWETMTAFSMEDNALWKRHLRGGFFSPFLRFSYRIKPFSVLTAIYVVRKQMHGDDRRLVAAMVLVFVSGTAKYAKRIWAVNRSSWDATLLGTCRSITLCCALLSPTSRRNFESFLYVAADGFNLSLHFLVDLIPSISLLPGDITEIKHGIEVFKTSEDIAHLAYKLAEVSLSLIYDYLYTKFGTRHFHVPPGWIAINRIATLCPNIGRASVVPDVVICYILLVSTILLETCSIFMSLISSCWAYKTIILLQQKCPLCGNFPCIIATMASIANHLHPEDKGEWSAKMARYSIIGDCIKEKQESGLLRRTLSLVGFDQKTVTHIGISPELKKLVLDKLLGIAATPRVQEWDIGVGKFGGQWAQWVVGEMRQDDQQSIAQEVLQVSNIQGLEFVSSVILWHVVTDICLLAADDDHVDGSSSTHHTEHLDGSSSSHQDDVDGDHSNSHGDGGAHLGGGSNSPSDDADAISAALRLRCPARELSDYVMYLVADCGAMAGSEGHYAVIRAKREMSRWLREKSATSDRMKVIEEIRNENSSFFHEDYYPVLDRALRVASDMLNIGDAGDRWELVAAVWLEMLCYIAYNCGAAFHAKHLTTGGEFVTHVKMLLFMLGVPFLRDVKEPLFAGAGNIYS